MLQSFLTEIGLGLALGAAAWGFGWYLYHAFRRMPPPVVVRSGVLADVAMVLEMGLVTMSATFLVHGALRVVAV